MKIREMSQYEIFKKDKRKCGVLYAALWFFDLPYRFDNSRSKLLKHISNIAFDWCDRRFRKCCIPVGKELGPSNYIVFDPVLKSCADGQSFDSCEEAFGRNYYLNIQMNRSV